jgi:hypothetical protein
MPGLKKRKDQRMSITFQNVKFGLKENDELKYLSEIVVDGENVSYQLSEEGQVWPNNEAAVLIQILRKAEPDKEFLVIDADA